MATEKQTKKAHDSLSHSPKTGRIVSTNAEGIAPIESVGDRLHSVPFTNGERSGVETAKVGPNDEAVTYSSPLAASMHESMADLYELGLIDKATMREFDDSCLTPVPTFGAEEIKALREREQASQAVLARHLGVSLNAVGQWERGERKASGAAAKLLALVHAHGLSYIR